MNSKGKAILDREFSHKAQELSLSIKNFLREAIENKSAIAVEMFYEETNSLFYAMRDALTCTDDEEERLGVIEGNTDLFN